MPRRKHWYGNSIKDAQALYDKGVEGGMRKAIEALSMVAVCKPDVSASDSPEAGFTRGVRASMSVIEQLIEDF